LDGYLWNDAVDEDQFIAGCYWNSEANEMGFNSNSEAVNN
jgi:hypothetical protein